MISHRRLCLLRCPVRGIAFVHRFRVSGTLMRCAPYCGAPYGVSPAVHLRCIALHYVFSKNQLLFLTCPYHTLSPNTCIVTIQQKRSCAFMQQLPSLFSSPTNYPSITFWIAANSSSYVSYAGISGYSALMASVLLNKKPALLAWIMPRSLWLSPLAMVS